MRRSCRPREYSLLSRWSAAPSGSPLVFISREGPSQKSERGSRGANIRRNPPYSIFERGPRYVARLLHSPSPPPPLTPSFSLSISLSFSIWPWYNNIDVSLTLAHEERRELELVLGACMANEEVLPFHCGGQLPVDLRGIFYARAQCTHTQLSLFIDLPNFQNAYRYGSLEMLRATD